MSMRGIHHLPDLSLAKLEDAVDHLLFLFVERSLFTSDIHHGSQFLLRYRE